MSEMHYCFDQTTDEYLNGTNRRLPWVISMPYNPPTWHHGKPKPPAELIFQSQNYEHFIHHAINDTSLKIGLSPLSEKPTWWQEVTEPPAELDFKVDVEYQSSNENNPGMRTKYSGQIEFRANERRAEPGMLCEEYPFYNNWECELAYAGFGPLVDMTVTCEE
ncbi:hypothetical protein BDV96DRAFT_645249 [Lophiotrema nucula]|uniref:Uncharacterized protein n=1 Tax=Lophiotrema nucula TaxID=690887 RepID=A0A6A5ZCB5_9PLEO|nr:hypothetical protein BDV96DRAFT_645249 [Lophiotrema nucula]